MVTREDIIAALVLSALVAVTLFAVLMDVKARQSQRLYAEEITTTAKDPVTTVGNHSFFSMNISKRSSDFHLTILKMLESFEKGHPELEVTNWRFHVNGNAIEGLWIDHKPKK